MNQKQKAKFIWQDKIKHGEYKYTKHTQVNYKKIDNKRTNFKKINHTKYCSTQGKMPYEQLCEEIKRNGDFSEIFSKGNERGSRYYCQHKHNIENTYLLFFDESGHTIKTDWKPTYQEKIFCFPGNSSFEISGSVYTGFRETIKLINNLAENDLNEYFIACPTYITTKEYTKQQFIDCQPVVTGKCFEGVSVKVSCMEEIAGELGIVPVKYDENLISLVMIARNTSIHTKIGDVHNYMINISDCVPYDGKEIIPPAIKKKEVYCQKIQIVIYGKRDDFLSCLSQINQRSVSRDFEDIRAIRLIPLHYMPTLYPHHFE